MHIPDPVHHLGMRDQLGLPRDLLEIICSQDKVLFYSSQFIRCSRFIHTTAWCLAVAQYIESTTLLACGEIPEGRTELIAKLISFSRELIWKCGGTFCRSPNTWSHIRLVSAATSRHAYLNPEHNGWYLNTRIAGHLQSQMERYCT
jgi:hypothetical protein